MEPPEWRACRQRAASELDGLYRAPGANHPALSDRDRQILAFAESVRQLTDGRRAGAGDVATPGIIDAESRRQIGAKAAK